MTVPSDDNEVELKPCPFCGPTAIPELLSDQPFSTERVTWYVKCSDCEMRTQDYVAAEFAVDFWNARATPTTAPLDARIRRHEISPERWEELQAALDRPTGPTEEEAEEVLCHYGTSGKEVVNGFIERLMRENLELKQRLATTPTHPETPQGVIELLDAAMLHPESAEGYIRQVIEMLSVQPEPPSADARTACKVDVQGRQWSVCGAPADQPCMCDVYVAALPQPSPLPQSKEPK